MSYRLEFTIEGLPKATSNANQHWKARWVEMRKWKRLVYAHINASQRPSEPLNKAKVSLYRFAHGKRPDQDNLRASFKHVVDALVESEVIKDDCFSVIGEPLVFWEKAPPRKGFIKVIVESL